MEALLGMLCCEVPPSDAALCRCRNLSLTDFTSRDPTPRLPAVHQQLYKRLSPMQHGPSMLVGQGLLSAPHAIDGLHSQQFTGV